LLSTFSINSIYLQHRCIMDVIKTKSDVLGSAASALCVIHCVATPFLFVAQSCSASATACCSSGPMWWSAIDYVFIAVTFLAVYFSARNTSKDWMKYALYAIWVILTLLIVNEKASLVPLPEILKYISAFSLVGLHLYNRKYCQCATQSCCATA
jgi:hypothetical protein